MRKRIDAFTEIRRAHDDFFDRRRAAFHHDRRHGVLLRARP